MWLCQTVYGCLHASVWAQRATWHPSWAGWQARRLWRGRTGRFRGEEGRVPILPPHPCRPHQADLQMEKMFTPGAGGWPPQRDYSVRRKQVLLVSARVWQEVAFGWQEVGFSSYQPWPRGRRAVIWGYKQSYREVGPQHPIPDRAGGTAHPSWSFGM